MKLKFTTSLTRNSLIFFAVILAIVLLGFWQTYFSNPFQVSGLVQIHGLGMTLWCLMLMSQAFLIKSKRVKLHRAIGMSSYVLVPVNATLMLLVARNFIARSPERVVEGVLNTESQYFISSSFADAGLFVVLFVLAMLHRREAAIHAKYMICTPLPVIAAATDRIIYSYFPGLAQFWLEDVGAVHMETLTWLFVDLGLFVLAIYEWWVRRPVHIFARAFGLFVAFQAAAMMWLYIPLMKAFGNWFVGV